MTDSTTSQVTADSPTPESAAPEKPARRRKTLTVALAAVVALVVGLGVGGVSGWAIANAQRPQFGNGQLPGGPGGDGDFQPPGDAPQRGDDAS